MEAFLSSTSVSSEIIEDGHGSRNYDLLPAVSTTSLRSQIPEGLLQDDASTLSPSYSEPNTLTRHNALQESASSLQREPPLQRDSSRPRQVAFPGQQDIQDQPEYASESSASLFQEWNHAEAGQDARRPLPKFDSWKERLGTYAMISLFIGSVLLCAAIGTLAFIWFGNSAIPAWKEITARNWLSKAISICIGVIQQVMMLQLGIVTATLASLALECREVVISDVASVSAMRATAMSTGAFVMAWQYVSEGSYRNGRHSSNIFLILSVALLWCLSQFFLLIILTDVSLRSTPGLASLETLPYSLYFNVTPRTDGIEEIGSRFQGSMAPGWDRKISKYASFAEYSEPPYEADGVSDTGVTLRAFLPFGTAQNRENLESYKGKSTVLDARVTCQVPQIENATIDSGQNIRGSLAATRNTPRFSNLTLDNSGDAKSPAGIDFSCVIVSESILPTSPWSLSLCQLWIYNKIDRNKTDNFGGLYSEFQDPSLTGGTGPQGSAYLFLNVTLGGIEDLVNQTDLVVADASKERGEWLDLIYSNGSVIISASICYAAFDFADIDVSITSQSNRTESRLEPVFDGAKYTFQELRYAMGQGRSLSIKQRGMLELAKGTWQVAPDKDHPKSRLFLAYDLREIADLDFTYSSYTYSSRTSYPTCVLSEVYHTPFSQDDASQGFVIPESMHVSCFLDYMILPHHVDVTLAGLGGGRS